MNPKNLIPLPTIPYSPTRIYSLGNLEAPRVQSDMMNTNVRDSTNLSMLPEGDSAIREKKSGISKSRKDPA
jgi:hypothetical protein